MYADIARRRLAQIRKSAFPAYAADRAHPLHSTNEADLLVVLTLALLIRDVIRNSGMDLEQSGLFVEAILFSTSSVLV